MKNMLDQGILITSKREMKGTVYRLSGEISWYYTLRSCLLKDNIVSSSLIKLFLLSMDMSQYVESIPVCYGARYGIALPFASTK
jgi:hypothetical protein